MNLNDCIDLTVTKEYNISKQRISDLLCCALEGGSNYWYVITGYVYPTGKDKHFYTFKHLELPLDEGGKILISDKEGDPSFKDKVLDLNSIKKGLTLMSKSFPDDFDDFINENEDANTGDKFLQLCLFGEIIFG